MDSYRSMGESNASAIEGFQVAGTFYVAIEKLDSAEICYLRSYSLAKRLGKKRFQLVLIIELTDLYLQKDQFPIAMQYLLKAESMMRYSPFRYELTILYDRLCSCYRKIGDKKRMVFYQQKYIQAKNALYNETMTNNLMKIESEYIERTNKARITEQEQLLSLKDQIIERQRMLNALVGVMVSLLIMLLYVLYRSNSRKKLMAEILDSWVKERTAALESSYSMHKQVFDAKNAAVVKVFSSIGQYIATLKGLCAIGLNGNGLTSNYFRKMFILASEASDMLNKVRDLKNEYNS